MKIILKIKSAVGLTLSELLMASILIGIVMTGVLGFNYVIKSMEDTGSKSSISSVRAAAALSLLKKDAEQAVGDAVDNGITTGSAGNNRSICFRQDIKLPGKNCNGVAVQPPDGSACNTPADYSDDRWVCYWTVNYVLSRCVAKANPSPPTQPFPPGGGLCDSSVTNLATISSITPNCVAPCNPADFFTLNTIPRGDAYTHIQSIDFTVRYKNSSTTATTVLQNPEEVLTTRVVPLLHSQ